MEVPSRGCKECTKLMIGAIIVLATVCDANKYAVTTSSDTKYSLSGQNVTLHFTIENLTPGVDPDEIRLFVQTSETDKSVLFKLVLKDGKYETQNQNIWDGDPLTRFKGRSSIQFLKPNVQVTVANVSVEDFTIYTLRANKVGKSQWDLRNSKAIQLVQGVPPKIDRHPFFGTEMMRKGSTMEFICRASGVPTPTVKWILEDKVITLGQKDATLTIEKAKSADANNYVCRARNDVGTDQKEMSLTVSYIEFDEGGKEGEVLDVRREQKNLIVKCNIDGYPDVKYKWFNPDGYTIETVRTLKQAPPNGIQMFGNYTCEGENHFGKLEYVVQVREVSSKKKKSIKPQDNDTMNREDVGGDEDGSQRPLASETVQGLNSTASCLTINYFFSALLNIFLFLTFLVK